MNLKEEEEFFQESQAQEALEKEFQEVLNDLATDPSLERFRV